MAEVNSGLMGSVRQLLSTLTSVVSTRLELLANELQEERLRLTQMIVFALCALFCFGLGMLLITVLIVALFWEDHRIAVLGVLCTIFFVLGVVMTLLMRSKMQVKSKLFSASLAELAKDRQHLSVHHEPRNRS